MKSMEKGPRIFLHGRLNPFIGIRFNDHITDIMELAGGAKGMFYRFSRARKRSCTPWGISGQVQRVPAAHRQQVQRIAAFRGADALNVRVTGEVTDDHLAIGQGQVVVPLVFHYIRGLIVGHLQGKGILFIVFTPAKWAVIVLSYIAEDYNCARLCCLF